MVYVDDDVEREENEPYSLHVCWQDSTSILRVRKTNRPSITPLATPFMCSATETEST